MRAADYRADELLCPGKEAKMVSDDFIAVSDVTQTVVCETQKQKVFGVRSYC